MNIELNHIYNMDCLEGLKHIKDNSINLIIIDPPYYNIKGDFDFKLTFENWQKLHEDLAVQCKRVLKDNGSIYLYGHAKNIAYQQVIFDKYFNLENSLIWYKLDCQTNKGIGGYRCYAPVTERILFYSNEVGQTGLEAITEKYIKPRNPFSLYLREELKSANVTAKEIAKLFPSKTGGLTGCVSNWLNGDNVITEEQYQKVRRYLECNYLNKPYEDLRAEYEDLRAEYEDLRRPFYNTKHTDILKFSQQVNITGKYDHPTQKPPKLSNTLIKISSRKNDTVLIPFVGSGVECVECKELDRNYIGFELDKDYCEIAEKRLKKVNNKKLGEWFK